MVFTPDRLTGMVISKAPGTATNCVPLTDTIACLIGLDHVDPDKNPVQIRMQSTEALLYVSVRLVCGAFTTHLEVLVLSMPSSASPTPG
jgi:hypothetical protein